MGELGRVVIVGAGLIGTSVGLALRERGVGVELSDRDPAALRLAEQLGAGTQWGAAAGSPEPADLAVLAVPSGAVPDALRQAQRAGMAHVYTDVGSVKRDPIDRASAGGCALATFVGGHPLAGRERAGPAAARADLFLGRPWVLCPLAATEEPALAAATALVRACGAEPVTLDLDAHDRAVALVSHLPHVVASAAAARLRDADAGSLDLAGQGLRDTTRVADGDPDLWTDILVANAEPVAAVLDALIADLRELTAALRPAADEPGTTGPKDAAAEQDRDVVADLLRRGAAGRMRVPGKRGGATSVYTVVPVVIRDRPGELGRLFETAGTAGVNVEDVALEHSPGLPVGVAELSVRPEQASVLTERLLELGWSVHR